MKTQHLFISFFLLTFIGPLAAQQTLPFHQMKKNGFNIAPVPVFTKDKEIHLGYERAVNASISWEFNLGYRYQADNEEFEPYERETMVNSQVRTCRNGVMFLFFLPIPVVEKCKSWHDTEVTNNEEYTRSNMFINASYKWYAMQFSKSKVPNGVYLSPGLMLGHRKFDRYTYKRGQRADITVLDTDFRPDEINPWGIVFGTGFVGQAKIIEETLYNFSSLEKEEFSKTYIQPNLRVGAAIPIANSMTLDLGGQVTFGKKHSGYSNHPVHFSPVVKLGVRF